MKKKNTINYELSSGAVSPVFRSPVDGLPQQAGPQSDGTSLTTQEKRAAPGSGSGVSQISHSPRALLQDEGRRFRRQSYERLSEA